MSVSTSSSRPVLAQEPLDPRANWISPKQQLYNISFAKKVTDYSGLIPDIAQIVAQYVGDEPAKRWHTAYSRLGLLPMKIPPLPNHIDQILDGKCPIYGDQVQVDGTYLKVKDTHILALIPEELGTLNQLEEYILKPYGKKKYSKQEHPLQFRSFADMPRAKYADNQFPVSHWVLMTKDVLPGSKDKTLAEQVELISAINKKYFVKYEIPTLHQGVVSIFTHKVATEESCYQQAEDNLSGTHTRVQETTNFQIFIGGCNSSGMLISAVPHDRPDKELGMAAVRNL